MLASYSSCCIFAGTIAKPGLGVATDGCNIVASDGKNMRCFLNDDLEGMMNIVRKPAS
jgi:hypothetical protein